MKKLFGVSHNSKNVDFALLFMRIAITLLMLTHGIPKMAGFAQSPIRFMEILGLGHTMTLSLAVFAEVVCSVFVLLGLGTRLAVIPLIITMLVAVLHIHGEDPFAKQEMAIHFLIVYVLLFILGSGKYSMDSLLVKKKRNDLL